MGLEGPEAYDAYFDDDAETDEAEYVPGTPDEEATQSQPPQEPVLPPPVSPSPESTAPPDDDTLLHHAEPPGAQNPDPRRRATEFVAHLLDHLRRPPPGDLEDHARKDLHTLESMAANIRYADTITRLMHRHPDAPPQDLVNAARHNTAQLLGATRHFLHKGPHHPAARALLSSDPHFEANLTHLADTAANLPPDATATQWLNLYRRHLPLLNTLAAVSKDRTLRAPLLAEINHQDAKRALGRCVQRSTESFHANRRGMLNQAISMSGPVSQLEAALLMFNLLATCATPAVRLAFTGSLALARFAINPLRAALRTRLPAHDASQTTPEVLAVHAFTRHLTQLSPRAQRMLRPPGRHPAPWQWPDHNTDAFRRTLTASLRSNAVHERIERFVACVHDHAPTSPPDRDLSALERLEHVNATLERTVYVDETCQRLQRALHQIHALDQDPLFARYADEELDRVDRNTLDVARAFAPLRRSADPTFRATPASLTQLLLDAHQQMPPDTRKEFTAWVITDELKAIEPRRKNEIPVPAPLSPPSVVRDHVFDPQDIRQVRWLHAMADTIEYETRQITTTWQQRRHAFKQVHARPAQTTATP